MVYVNWEACSSVANLPTFKWYSISSVTDYIQRLRPYIIYSLPRETSMPVLSCTEIPASQTERFQGYFICEGIGNWGFNLDKLSWHMARLNSCPSCRLSASAIELGALCTVHEMLRAIERKVDIIDQCTFETRYGLVWKAAEEDAHDVMKCPNVFCHCFKNAIVYISFLFGKDK